MVKILFLCVMLTNALPIVVKVVYIVKAYTYYYGVVYGDCTIHIGSQTSTAHFHYGESTVGYIDSYTFVHHLYIYESTVLFVLMGIHI